MDKETTHRAGALTMAALLALTLAAAGCEQRRDTQVVDTPNGKTTTSTTTVQVDKEQVDRAKDKVNAAAADVKDQASAVAGQASASLSDAGVTAKVKTRLATDNRVSASSVNVDTENRVVTLRGTVATEAARQAAVEIARGTDGVKDVVDRLTVGAV